jgi:predicted nucleic acid-binding protein
VLRHLLVDHECCTTFVVLSELRAGIPVHRDLQAALELEWVRPVRLETLPELECFAKWVGRIGAGDRNLGEASVFAVAELRGGTAITDDQPATRVATNFRIEVHGTVWLLCRACKAGKLTVAAAGNLVDMLRATGMRLPCTGPEFDSWARHRSLL